MTTSAQLLKDIVRRLRADGHGSLSRGETQTVLEWLDHGAVNSVRLTQAEKDVSTLRQTITELEVTNNLKSTLLEQERQKVFDGYFQAALPCLHVGRFDDEKQIAGKAFAIAHECIAKRKFLP